MSVSDCRIVELPKIQNSQGNLTFIENSRHIPFDIKRVYTFTMFLVDLSAAHMLTSIYINLLSPCREVLMWC